MHIQTWHQNVRNDSSGNPCSATWAFHASIASRFSSSQRRRRSASTSAANPRSQAWERLIPKALASCRRSSGNVIFVARRGPAPSTRVNTPSTLHLRTRMRIWNAHGKCHRAGCAAPGKNARTLTFIPSPCVFARCCAVVGCGAAHPTWLYESARIWRMRAAKRSIAKGLVRTCMPGSRCSWLKAAVSA